MSCRSLLLAMALLTTVTTVGADQSDVTKPGGWSEVSVTEEGVVAAAAFAVQAKQTVMRENGGQAKPSLEQVVSAQQQVVQGMNYRLALRVLHDGQVRTAEAVVWARVWLDEADRYQLTSWRYTDTTPEDHRPGD